MTYLFRIFRYLKPYGWYLFFGFLTTILPVMMELSIPRLLQFIIDDGILPQSMTIILQGTGLMFLAALVGAVSTLGQGWCRAIVSQGLAFDIRYELFNHIQSLSFANFDQMKTGQLMTRISSDVDVVRMFSSAGLALLLRVILMIIGSMFLIITIDFELSLIMISVVLVSGVFIYYIIQKATVLFGVVQQKLGSLNTLVQENLAGIQVVKAFVRSRYAIDQFAVSNNDYREKNVEVSYLMAVAMPILQILTNVGTVAVLWFGGMAVIGDRLTMGELVAFNNYLMIGMGPLLFLGNLLMMAARADASAKRVLEVFETDPILKIAPNAHSAEKINGHVVFENVSFQYQRRVGDDDGEKRKITGDEVLQNISFEVQAGQHVALLGATGSGKSTLVNLIPRFYDVTGGSICVDGVDVRDWSPSALRGQVGMVLQESTLFSGTIRDNIAYGKPDVSLEEVIQAAKIAQAHDFISAMPQGYDSVVEAGGTNLSGGQKQRVAIARALLIQPGILIFDDSTSAVDMETEFKIQEALEALQVNRTTFIIAQRISSVLNADQILLLERGEIVGQGTHSDLLENNPLYQEIYHSQLGDLTLSDLKG